MTTRRSTMPQAEKSSRSRQTPSSPETTSARSWWRRPGTFFTGLFLTAVIGFASVIHRVIPDLQHRPEYQFRVAETRITPPHAWVPPNLLQEVLSASELPATVSLLDPELCRRVAIAWEHHPWVKRVNSVQISSDRTLVVDVDYRTPVAFIQVDQGFYPVDAEGVLLPPRDFSVAATERLPQIRNISSHPQAGAGEAWGDPVVTAAARLADFLVPQQDLELYWNRFGFRAIVAPALRTPAEQPEQVTFELETTGGNRVVWGKAPGADALEPTPEVKLARLGEYQTRFGSLDGVSGLHRIDIRLFDGISLQPLAETRLR